MQHSMQKQITRQITKEHPCTWTAIMRNLNVIVVQEGYRSCQGVNRLVYAFTLGRLTQKQLEWVLRFPNVEVAERDVQGIARPDGSVVKRIFTVYLYPANEKEKR